MNLKKKKNIFLIYIVSALYIHVQYHVYKYYSVSGFFHGSSVKRILMQFHKISGFKSHFTLNLSPLVSTFSNTAWETADGHL